MALEQEAKTEPREVQTVCRHCGTDRVACPTCGAEMPTRYRFCGACGTALGGTCPACQGVVSPAHRYCAGCGARLPRAIAAAPDVEAPVADADRAPRLPSASASRNEERRRVAILFADLSGSTAMADALEMETTFRVVSECVGGLARIATEAGGYVVKTLGDGLMVLFGAPMAYGDDPIRAGRAALRMQTWLAEFAEGVQAQHGVGLRLRIGINYGSVVAASLDTGGRSSFDVLGDAVNVAQRLEAAAEPDTVCVSDTFYRITAAAFEYRDRGVVRVKGKPEPLPLFELVAERGLEGRPPTGFALFGRDRELALLKEAAEGVAAGGSGTLALVGPPGIGKSRLLDELSGQLVEAGLPVLRGVGKERSTPLLLWRSWVAELLALTEDLDWESAVARVRAALGEATAAQWAEVLAALVVDPARLRTMEEGQSDHVLRTALGAFLHHWRGGKPAAVVVDEASLLDSLSLRLLVELGRGAGGSLLVVAAGNPNADYPPAEMRRLEIEPISASAARQWLADSLPGVTLPDDVVARAIERAGGNPLF
ncbi:MAG: cyaB, partial [Armatimonadetes bacterium]|nr:cyaB [Armatimonadota bacterium]